VAKATGILHEDLLTFIILPRHLGRKHNKSVDNVGKEASCFINLLLRCGGNFSHTTMCYNSFTKIHVKRTKPHLGVGMFSVSLEHFH
jgi:hypothetical protein